jgi:hypothetical protein
MEALKKEPGCSSERARQKAQMLKTVGARRKKLMNDYEFIVSLLILIIQHQKAVHAGDANPIKDEMVDGE